MKGTPILLVVLFLVLTSCSSDKQQNEDLDYQDNEEIQYDDEPESVRPADQTIAGNLQFSIGQKTFQFESFNKMKTDFLLSDKGVTVVLTLPDKKKAVSFIIDEPAIFESPMATYSLEKGSGSGITFQGFTSDDPLNNYLSRSGEITLTQFDLDGLNLAGTFEGKAVDKRGELIPFKGSFDVTFSNLEDYRSTSM